MMNHNYRITHLGGQGRSGSDKAGYISHAVANGRALCGKEPGRHSIGWSEYDDKVITCHKCLHILLKVKDAPDA